MAPLVAHMDAPLAATDVSITVWDDSHINAANAGGGAFYVTTGLLARASDDQLRAIIAHEVAHADLGHVAKTQTLATGLGLGTLILDQICQSAQLGPPIGVQKGTPGWGRAEAMRGAVGGAQRIAGARLRDADFRRGS